jgi:ubiquinone/menaquinone biosynthesis C-methylase UbiE
MDHSTYKRFLEEDMQRLEKLIVEAAESDAGLQRKIDGNQDLLLLNLACGACNEAETLAKVFGGNEGASYGNGNMKFVGLDVRAREIAEAAARFRSVSDTQFEFINGDATKLDTYQQLPGSFDVIFMRHQNLWNGKRTWEEIYHKALEKLSPNGRLIITSYFDREHAEAIDVIRNQGGDLLLTKANEKSRRLPMVGRSVDRHLAVLKRAK